VRLLLEHARPHGQVLVAEPLISSLPSQGTEVATPPADPARSPPGGRGGRPAPAPAQHQQADQGVQGDGKGSC
jgi:hypothetical protein